MMFPTPAVLAADAVEADALREAFNAAFGDYLIGPMAVSAEAWPLLLARQGAQLAASRVIVEGGQVLAFALVAPHIAPGRSRLATMGARPEARGAGHAPRLLDRVLAEAQARGDRSIELEVFARNARALALYHSRGFEQVAELHGYARASGGALVPVEDRIDESGGQADAVAWLEHCGVEGLPFQQTAASIAALRVPLKAWRCAGAQLVFSDADPLRIGVLCLVDADARQHGARQLARALAAHYPQATLRMPQLLRPDRGGDALAAEGWQVEPLHQLLLRRSLSAARAAG
ncbi:GNAT family N-acetyltransferase [Aquincola sp. S2]|uniref:GNAT family N-acetyltransferase n=1 Tax=Pseudaquabacterium terrae TaxID=2732868 RepID=A0ABX2ECA6_9BURK|nr:GNAT family N-acetyltransferase [Aquabacterium terrae]NRF66206.1 GNAT family N-acetyltransferase [Aquabacterium terrae]